MELQKLNTLLLFTLSLLILSPFNFLPQCDGGDGDDTATSSSSIHDLLQSQGLPPGLFPKNVKSFSLDDDGHLEVHFEQPCMARFESRVKFDTVVRANLSYGGLIGVEGLSQEELFLWLPVKDIIVSDPSSGLILFNIVVALKQLSFSLFEDPPICKPQGFIVEELGRKGMGY